MIAAALAFHLLVAVIVDGDDVRILDAGAKGSRAKCEVARATLIEKLRPTLGVLDEHAVAFASACKVAGIKA